VPRTAGALSACGMQFADLVSEHTASEPVRSRDFAAASANAALDAIDVELERFAAPLEARGYGDRTIGYTVSAHYASQVWELEVPLPVRRFGDPRDAEQLARAFHDMHERVFAVRDEQSEIEFLSWTGRVTLRLPRALSKLDPARAPAERERRLRTAWFGEGESCEAQIVRGPSVSVGERIAGPAIIEEETSTLVLPPGSSAVLSPFGTYIVEIQ
jgi:N-methylhydantoinase A